MFDLKRLGLVLLLTLGVGACGDDASGVDDDSNANDEGDDDQTGDDDEDDDDTPMGMRDGGSRDGGGSRDSGRPMDGGTGALMDAASGTGEGGGTDRDGGAGTSGDAGSQPDAGGGTGMESACKGPVSPKVDPLPLDVALPIVFVHGFAGSAQQYQSQAMRFVANGYPAERIVAYDHDGEGMDYEGYANGVDEVVESVREKFGVEQVYLVGHSRGTFVAGLAYLADPARAAKVAKYISLDGIGCLLMENCLELFQTTFPGQAHVEVATSAESFAEQYEFLVGRPPVTTDILPDGEPVVISGRVVNFPANTGRAGVTLDIYEIDPETGARVRAEPHASFQIDETGDFGPVTVGCGKYYEKVLSSPETDIQHHFYLQPYVRSTSLVRLLTSGPESATAMNTNRGPNHVTVIAMRMREWYADSDVLNIETIRPSGGAPSINAIADHVSNGNIGIFIHDDAASPGESSLGQLPNLTGAFQASVDVFMPAADPPDGTVIMTSLPRGETDLPQVIKFPNWASTGHTITAAFNDYAQPAP